MLIEDKELRSLYEAASTEHIDKLEAGILSLETAPSDLSIMKDLLREAHSLKGDSRMLGVGDAETLTHELESLLQAVNEGQAATPDLCQRLYQGLDAIRQIARSAVTGEPCDVNVFATMTLLMGGSDQGPDDEVDNDAEPTAPAMVTPEVSVHESVHEEAFEAVVAEASAAPDDEMASFAAAVALLQQAEQSDSESLVEAWSEEPIATEVAPVAQASSVPEAAPEAAPKAAPAAAPAATLTLPGMPAEVTAALNHAAAAGAGVINTDVIHTGVTETDLTGGAGGEDSFEPTEADLETIPFRDGETSYFIEDDELRDLYKVASIEHLENLQTGILQLEQQPDDLSQMRDMLREAHSLKGDSRMLGVHDAENLTHELETLLQEVDQGQRVVDRALCDRLYQGLDAIRQIAHSAVTGDPCTVNVFQVMTQLLGADTPPETDASAETRAPAETRASAEIDAPADTSAPADAERQLPPEAKTVLVVPQVEPGSSGAIAPASPKPTAPATDLVAQPVFVSSATTKIQPPEQTPSRASTNLGKKAAGTTDSIRVESSKLDTLITQVSELAVAKRRITDWEGSITELLDLWEGWAREALVNQRTLGQAQSLLPPEVAQSLEEFYGSNQHRIERLGEYVQHLRRQTSEDAARLNLVAGNVEAGVRNLRMLPLSKVFSLFRRMVRDLAMQQGKTIEFIIEGGDTQVDKRIIEEIKDPLSHLLRNAVDHGIETVAERMEAAKSPTATLKLRGYRQGGSVIVELSDDGRGLDLDSIKAKALSQDLCDEVTLARMSPEQVRALIFQPGFSTREDVSEISGRGVGLDVVRTNVERLKGSIDVQSNRGKGCQFRLTLNPSLATSDAIILTNHQTTYAMPIEAVDRMLMVNREDLFAIKGNLTATIANEPISVTWLSDLLECHSSLPAVTPAIAPATAPVAGQVSSKLPCIVIDVGGQKLGIFVDGLSDQQEIVLKPPSKILQRVRNIAGSTILGDGEICLILNPQDLLKTALKQKGALDTFEKVSQKAQQTPRILLVEDSIPIRTQVKRILEGAGYEVTATVDGLDGYNTLRAQEQAFLAIVSDVEMPNLTGLELAAKVREHREYDDLPFVLVTTLATEQDRQRGREAGANAYLTKGDFDQNLLLDTLRGLIQP